MNSSTLLLNRFNSIGKEWFGVSFSFECYEKKKKRWYCWDGKTKVFQMHPNAPPMHYCHELAHYQFSSPKRRQHPEFMLGENPDPWFLPVEKRTSTDIAVFEEHLASIQTFYFAKLYNKRFTKTPFKKTSLYTSCLDILNGKFDEYDLFLLNSLKNDGFIKNELPTKKINMSENYLDMYKTSYSSFKSFQSNQSM